MTSHTTSPTGKQELGEVVAEGIVDLLHNGRPARSATETGFRAEAHGRWLVIDDEHPLLVTRRAGAVGGQPPQPLKLGYLRPRRR